MELTELYNQIQNPIDDPMVIEKLIYAYANLSNGFGGYYGKLTKTTKKKYNNGQYYQQDADKFYAMLFNKWKNSIVAMTKEEFVELYKQGSYGRDFIQMRQYLKSVFDVSTMKEADEIFYGQKGDKDLESALEKYSWKSFGSGSGWVHVCSRYLTAKKDKYPNIEHRLYLNTESIDTYKMTTYLVEKCDKYHLPYYFKFDQYADRDDTIVIYSSTENLFKYIEILQEIKKEHPELVHGIKEPPVLTGKIDGWIGYGSEPERTPDGKKHSFNKIRANELEYSIGKVTKEWIMNHSEMQITYQGQNLSFQEYIAMKATEKLIYSLEKRYLLYEKTDKNAAQKNRTAYNPVTVNERLGYTLNDVRSLQFKEYIYRILKSRIAIALSEICKGSYKDVEAINIGVRNGKQVTFSGYDLETTIQQKVINISKNDPNFIRKVQLEIKKNAKQYGIDANKFCFDLKRSQALSPQYKKTNTQSAEENMSLLDAQSFLKTINPALLEREMHLPNGVLMPAKKYIQEIVFPQLPKNGVVILADGGFLSVKQFVEEGVMFECQEKYNGDFPRYMASKTKNNLDVVTIDIGNERHKIDPVYIINFINPSLLERRVKLSNGVEISVRQYLQEIYAPHIPANGRVILSNGVDISVKQYIEEVLLWEGQEKYNGDISKILFNTTRNNSGTINVDPKQLQQTLIEMHKQVDALNNSCTFS